MTSAKQLSIHIADQLAAEINHGVQSTFSTMFSIKPTMQPYRLEKNSHPIADVSGLISLTQEKIEGTLIVSFPKQTIFKMLEKMYKRPFHEVDSSVTAGVGELTNIVYGVFKSNMNKSGYSLKMALPNVVIGEQHTVLTTETGPTLVTPFTTELGDFQIRLSLNDLPKL